MILKKGFLRDFQDIREGQVPAVDFHLHTKWTDGQHTVGEMYEEALRGGLQAVLFSEHARRASEAWFGDFAREVRHLSGSCRALVGVETRVSDFEGHLDLTPSVLAECDLVMVSVHRFPDEKGLVRNFEVIRPEEVVETEFRLAMSALDHPAIDILGHPFGMAYQRFRLSPPDEKLIALIKRAAKNQVAFEINSHYHPDPWRLIGLCQKYGAAVSLGSNAHRTSDVGQIQRLLKRKEASWTPSAS